MAWQFALPRPRPRKGLEFFRIEEIRRPPVRLPQASASFSTMTTAKRRSGALTGERAERQPQMLRPRKQGMQTTSQPKDRAMATWLPMRRETCGSGVANADTPDAAAMPKAPRAAAPAAPIKKSEIRLKRHTQTWLRRAVRRISKDHCNFRSSDRIAAQNYRDG